MTREWTRHLTADAKICGGQLRAKGTRVPVAVILDALAEVDPGRRPRVSDVEASPRASRDRLRGRWRLELTRNERRRTTVERTRMVAPADLELAREFVRRLTERLDRRRFNVRLYGSRARGEADEESDLDLFVELDRDDRDESVKNAAQDVACALTLERGVLVSPFVADRDFRRSHRGYSFLAAIEAEGVPV